MGSLGSEAAGAARSGTVAVSLVSSFQLSGVMGHADADALRSCTSAVAIGFSDGRVLAHVGHGLVGPSWSQATSPQCVVDAKGQLGLQGFVT